MKRWFSTVVAVTCLASLFAAPRFCSAGELDRILENENRKQKVKLEAAPLVDDLTFLRRSSIDLIGRIPTFAEIKEYRAWPADVRREKVVDKLISDVRFADRWTMFYADMMRIRSNAEGGRAYIAFVHQAITSGMPYDEMVRRLIVTNGKANTTPEVGFVLGDNADPMALASATSQIFMGVRMGCAQCHDHPFDVWTQKDFYSLAAFYGKTRRVDSRLTRIVYTTETTQNTVLWPPAGEGDDAERKPIKPRFPVELAKGDRSSKYIERLVALRSRPKPGSKRSVDDDINALLNETATQASKQIGSSLDQLGIVDEANNDIRKIDIKGSLYRQSALRIELARFITSPRNRYFSRSFANRVWGQLIGRGFVNPVDDFRQDNPASHDEALDYLADEFVAGGYNLKSLIRSVVLSDAYRRSHVVGKDLQYQTDMEASFLATPMRRMQSEMLYDSVVVAGHLFDVKHLPGQNEKTVYDTIRVLKNPPKEGDPQKKVASILTGGDKLTEGDGPAMKKEMVANDGGGYSLEDAISLDFDAILKKGRDEVTLDKMKIMSKEEIEAKRMMEEESRRRPRGEYVTKQVKRVYDDNPRFNTSYRMASPAPAGHFLRVFGQTDRSQLGQSRDEAPTMRQALMMLNGRLTHEASRVGPLEPIFPLLVGKKANLDKAVRLAYTEILTRQPSEDELTESKEIIAESNSKLAGMADLRWILLNCNEFRYLP